MSLVSQRATKKSKAYALRLLRLVTSELSGKVSQTVRTTGQSVGQFSNTLGVGTAAATPPRPQNVVAQTTVSGELPHRERTLTQGFPDRLGDRNTFIHSTASSPRHHQ
jgi:hypothetical protein